MKQKMAIFLFTAVVSQAQALTPSSGQAELQQVLNTSLATPSMQTQTSDTGSSNAVTSAPSASPSASQPSQPMYQTPKPLVQPSANVGKFSTPTPGPQPSLTVKSSVVSSLPPVTLPSPQSVGSAAPSTPQPLVITPTFVSPNMNLFGAS